MTIQEAIQKAIEGGWKNEVDRDFALYKGQPHFALLDPLFWQAVGKSLGWNDEHHLFESGEVKDFPFECGICGQRFPERMPRPKEDYCVENNWRMGWHRLIDHLASGKSIEDYFKNL